MCASRPPVPPQTCPWSRPPLTSPTTRLVTRDTRTQSPLTQRKPSAPLEVVFDEQVGRGNQAARGRSLICQTARAPKRQNRPAWIWVAPRAHHARIADVHWRPWTCNSTAHNPYKTTPPWHIPAAPLRGAQTSSSDPDPGSGPSSSSFKQVQARDAWVHRLRSAALPVRSHAPSRTSPCSSLRAYLPRHIATGEVPQHSPRLEAASSFTACQSIVIVRSI